jgi:hypothetical protein
MAKTTDDGWEATRFGGYRRTTAPSSIGAEAEEEAAREARGVANPDVERTEESRVVATSSSNLTSRGGDTRRRFGVRIPGRGQIKYFGREALGLPTCPYLIRWRVETPWFSVRLHHWLGPDDERAQHDHPW